MNTFRPHCERSGLSLLEVILALAILALSMAAIGELIRVGTISASNAEDFTEAQILAESKLSEIMAGAVTADPVTRVPFVTAPDWFYTIELAATEETEVMALRVTVETHLDRLRPLSFSLVRWIPDPGIELPAEEEAAEEPDDSQDSSTGSGSSTNPPTGGGDIPDELPDDLPDNLPDGIDVPSGFGNGQGGRR
jgi:prepilin-type N-terminal cleavage/methylation domain-containing protein